MVGPKFFQTQGMKLRLIKAGPQIKFIRNMSAIPNYSQSETNSKNTGDLKQLK